MSLVSICAWCSDKDARTAAATAAGHVVTHGICPACGEREFAAARAACETVRKGPVVLVQGGVRAALIAGGSAFCRTRDGVLTPAPVSPETAQCAGRASRVPEAPSRSVAVAGAPPAAIGTSEGTHP